MNNENSEISLKSSAIKTYYSKKTIVLQYFNFIVLFGLLLFSYFTWGDVEYHRQWAKHISIIAIILFIYQISLFKPLNFKMWEFRTWFIVLTYLFMFGRVFLHGFNLDEGIYWDLSNRFLQSSLYNAGLIVLCNLQAFYIGFSFQKSYPDYTKKKNSMLQGFTDKGVEKLVLTTGIILVVFSVPFRLYEDIRAILITQSFGSYEVLTSTVGFSNDLAKLFIPAIIYIIVGLSSKNKNLTKGIIITISLYLLSVMILTGDRREQTIAIIVIWLCYIVSSNIIINYKKLIFWSVLGILFMDILTTISSIRLGTLTSLPEFITYYFDQERENNIFYSILSGFGLTFFSVAAIVEHIPSTIPYQFGLSFYGAIPSLLPIGWLIGDFFSTVSISPYVINRITGIPVGASIIGDLYANFGLLSIGISIFIGILLTKVFSLEKGKNVLYIAIYFSLFYVLINWVRGSFFESVRPLFLVYFVPIIIIILLKVKSKVKK